MRREDIQAMFKRIPEVDHTKVCVVLAGGQVINVELLFRMDDHLLTLRGREAGSNDEGRAFFLPYDQISYLKLEKMVRVSELEDIFGTGPKKPPAPPPAEAPKSLTATPPPAASLGGDPAGIARQNLLARIQAARTAAGAPGKPA
jgi:hypothetical protein